MNIADCRLNRPKANSVNIFLLEQLFFSAGSKHQGPVHHTGEALHTEPGQRRRETLLLVQNKVPEGLRVSGAIKPDGLALLVDSDSDSDTGYQGCTN
jgi:hypothetical protein